MIIHVKIAFGSPMCQNFIQRDTNPLPRTWPASLNERWDYCVGATHVPLPGFGFICPLVLPGRKMAEAQGLAVATFQDCKLEQLNVNIVQVKARSTLPNSRSPVAMKWTKLFTLASLASLASAEWRKHDWMADTTGAHSTELVQCHAPDFFGYRIVAYSPLGLDACLYKKPIDHAPCKEGVWSARNLQSGSLLVLQTYQVTRENGRLGGRTSCQDLARIYSRLWSPQYFFLRTLPKIHSWLTLSFSHL